MAQGAPGVSSLRLNSALLLKKPHWNEERTGQTRDKRRVTLVLITEADPRPHFVLLEQPTGEHQENTVWFLLSAYWSSTPHRHLQDAIELGEPCGELTGQSCSPCRQLERQAPASVQKDAPFPLRTPFCRQRVRGSS